MSKSQTMAIVAISTVVLRRKLYIVSLSTRTVDKKQFPEFTSNPSLALDFRTMEEANTTITNLVNHAEKVFKAEVVQVSQRSLPRQNAHPVETPFSESVWKPMR